VLTLIVLAEFPVGSGGSRLISTALGFALLLTALSLVFRQRLVAFYAARVGEVDADRTAKLTVATGAALGVLVSLSSVGAGAIGVTALLMLYPRLPIVRIVGSDIAHAVPLTLIAGTGHWLLGSVDWPMLGSLLCGSLPGIFIGSHFAGRVPDRVLRPILATTLVVVGSKLIF
jgi:uncharacterized protein